MLAGLGFLAAAWAVPADAAGQAAAPTLTVSRLWNQGTRAGSWTPYVVTVRNDGPGTFTGTAAVVPGGGGYGIGPQGVFPEYDASVVVPAGSVRSVTIYVVDVVAGYHAELRDQQGGVVTSASLGTGGAGAGAAVAIASDVPQVQQRVDALLRSQSRLDAAVSQFSPSQPLPADVVRMTGLNAIVLDQFDTGSLSSAQLRALVDFVGLGGTLVEAGGAGARRTLGHLPGDLVPLPPSGAAAASLAPLEELSGLSIGATAPVATGTLAAGAHVALAAPDGTPLVVESAYGAGDVVELAFDPLAAPFDGHLDLSAAAWTQALARGLGAAAGSGSQQLAKIPFAGPVFGAPPIGSGPGAGPGYASYVDEELAAAQTAPSPPFGLLAVLLILYIFAVSALTYAALRAVRRRGLLWVVVPVAAVACTVSAYAAGFGTRGSDFQVVQVQVDRPAPGGTVETSEFDGILNPRRGDVTLSAPAGSLVTTARTSIGPYQVAGDPARITVATAPHVTYPNVPVWDLRPLQVLSVTHQESAGPAMPIEARLALRSGRLQGQVVNHTSRPVRDLRLASSGAQVALAAAVAPGAAADVDVPMGATASTPVLGKGAFAIPGVIFGPVSAANAGQALVTLASTEVATRPGEWALVGQVDPVGTLRVGGERPHVTGRALVVEAVRLQSADSAAGAPPSRLVSSYTLPTGATVDVYEQVLPSGLTGRVTLGTSLVPGPPAAVAPSLEVYDWSTRAWRLLAGGGSAALGPGEVAGGVVRARVTSQGAQVALTLSDVP